MARIVAFSNQKGGVAKSTTVEAFASELTSRGFRVLMVDMDAQPGNLSLHVGADKGRPGTRELLAMARPSEAGAAACIQGAGGFGDVIAAYEGLDAADDRLNARVGREGILDWEARLRLSKELRVVVEMPAEERGARILDSPVRHATAAAQAQRHGETLGDYAPGRMSWRTTASSSPPTSGRSASVRNSWRNVHNVRKGDHMAKNDPLEMALGRKSTLAGHAVREDRARERYPRAINIAIDEDMYRAIALYAAKHGLQKNETVRRILAEGLADEIGEAEALAEGRPRRGDGCGR